MPVPPPVPGVREWVSWVAIRKGWPSLNLNLQASMKEWCLPNGLGLKQAAIHVAAITAVAPRRVLLMPEGVTALYRVESD